MRKLFLFFLLMMSINIAYTQTSQPRTVTGTVTDESGEPLIGVTIMVKGTTIGVISDATGKYAISVPQNAEFLVFSFIGEVTEEIAIGDNVVIDLSMKPDILGMEEVVVIGYGSVKKQDLTGSVGSVEAEKLASRGGSEAAEALQGQLAGVNISRSSGRSDVSFDIVIRGENSIEGGSPLFVVDGLVVDNIDFLNPNDIERMDVLKDASSTAIYGSRGSNGVILISTKSAGSATEKIRVTYDAYYGVKTPAHIANMMDGEEWLNFKIAAAQGNNPEPFSGDVFGSTNEVVPVTGEQWDREMERRLAAGETYNWPEKFMENGMRSNHYIALNGMSGKTAFSMTAGYQKEKGFIEKDYMDKYTFSLDINHKLTEKWEMGGQFRTGLKETEVAGGKSILNYYRMPPLALAEDPTGWLFDDEGLTVRPARWATGAVNPLLDQKYSNSNDRSIELIGRIFMDYKPVEWLDIRTDFLPRFSMRRDASYNGLYSESAGGIQEQTSASVDNQHRMNFTWDNRVNAVKSFGSHTIQGTALFSIYDFQQEDFDFEVMNLPQNTSFYNLGAAADRVTSESSYSMNRLVSYMGRFNYDYAQKYLLTLSMRYDGSSKLGEGYQWASFPSAAVAWRISEEAFLQDIDAISVLKMRLSYGFTGNNNISPYKSSVSANSLYYYDFGGVVTNGIGPSGIANNALTWERTEEVNLGLDFGFFRGRVSGTVDVYSRLSRDLLMDRKLPVPMGWDNMTDNIGSVSNKGIEALLRTINVKTKDFSWETSFIFSRNVNAVVETNLGKVDDVVNGLFIGEPVEVFYNYDFIGIWQLDEIDEAALWNREPGMLKIRDISGPDGIPDGKIDEQYDRMVIGKPIPDFTASLYTKMTFKNFDLSASIYTEQGIMKQSAFFNDLIYTSRNTVVHNYWTTTNPSNDAPNPAFMESDVYWGRKGAQLQNMRDASYTRLQNVTLGYTLPRSLTQIINIERLRVYANVTNPILITPFEGHDPEFGDKGANDGPSFITYQFGVNVNF
ncbi:MAG: TonB-dependent receptor [Bacteroidales bacterium]|nr:TonB-dependent receptor [Bacteroidales bacterium]MCF8391533.1 TonB-dependent receptor [Bacteroidales bacterium]